MNPDNVKEGTVSDKEQIERSEMALYCTDFVSQYYLIAEIGGSNIKPRCISDIYDHCFCFKYQLRSLDDLDRCKFITSIILSSFCSQLLSDRFHKQNPHSSSYSSTDFKWKLPIWFLLLKQWPKLSAKLESSAEKYITNSWRSIKNTYFIPCCMLDENVCCVAGSYLSFYLNRLQDW